MGESFTRYHFSSLPLPIHPSLRYAYKVWLKKADINNIYIVGEKCENGKFHDNEQIVIWLEYTHTYTAVMVERMWKYLMSMSHHFGVFSRGFALDLFEQASKIEMFKPQTVIFTSSWLIKCRTLTFFRSQWRKRRQKFKNKLAQNEIYLGSAIFVASLSLWERCLQWPKKVISFHSTSDTFRNWFNFIILSKHERRLNELWL